MIPAPGDNSEELSAGRPHFGVLGSRNSVWNESLEMLGRLNRVDSGDEFL